MHANPLPFMGSDGTFVACPPGSLVVSRGLIGGVALASTDATIGGVLHWFALGHKHHLMDVALAESYGWVKWWPFKTVSRKKKSKPKTKGKEKAGEEVETWRRRKRRSKRCGASAIRYLWAPGMG